MKQKTRLRKVEAPHLLVTSVAESPTRHTVITIPTLLSSPSDGLSTYLRRYYPQRLVTADRPCHPRMSFCRSTNKSFPSLLPTTYSHTETLPELTSCVTPSDVPRFISSCALTREKHKVLYTLPPFHACCCSRRDGIVFDFRRMYKCCSVEFSAS